MATDVSAQPAVSDSDRPAAAGRPTAGYATSLVLAILGVWFTVGLMVDAWAHNNVPELETFFTPWHAVFYSGFAATGAWVLWTCRAAIRDGQRALDAVPAGYGLTLIGLVTFALSGVGDLIWHTTLGIEQDVDILFSPTHVGLIASMFLIVSTPMRTAWRDPGLPEAPGLRRLLPAVLAATFAATLILLFMQYANALSYGPFGVIYALSGEDSGDTSQYVAEVAVTTAIIVVPLLTLARRWRLPVGATTILYVALGGLSTAVSGFENLDLIIAFVVAGVVVDALGAAVRPAPDQPGRQRLFAALAALITWSTVIGTAYAVVPPLDHAVPVKPELVYGVPLVQCALAVLLAVVLVPSRQGLRATAP
ncbi:hypothetical protein [Luedemannella helvata]|uniref:Uncharacterized protein n=1 Tax=Luedemannella helvata TaxID=349315 RepID=A0ABN2L1L4_9ACTN